MQNKVCAGSVSTSEDRKKQKKRLKGFCFQRQTVKCGVKSLKQRKKKKDLHTPPYREIKREGLLERETKRWWAQEEQIGAKKLLG